MSWQAAAITLLALAVAGGFLWFERSRPSARIVAAVAALGALGVAGRIVLAPIPNVVATTDVALLAGYSLGGGPGFAVGALSALVSNFWLGQGPWTPWQMAGWGMVGIAGALLAAGTGRRLNRWGLAGVAALMGFAYGALLDLSVMVSYGGEWSLDRYLALSARGVPFNVAHATGNFVLMLAAGPAMVRMLDRYRDRFEVSWCETPLPRVAAVALGALCLALPLLGPSGDAEAKGGGVGVARTWLAAAQNGDGGFGTEPEADSNPGMTGWAMLGLEAAGLNPRDVRTGARSPVDYLRENAAGIESTADLERTILALDGAGVDPRDFAGTDLVARLRDRQSRDGSFEHQVNLTAFAVLAQRAAGVGASSFGKAAAWLRSVQNRNGGWGSVVGAESEPDSTGAVLQALAVAPGGSGTAGELTDGARWLERVQHGDGGWSLTVGATSNSQSTAWAIQGLTATGRSASAVTDGGRSGLDYLTARQEPDGHYAYSSASDQTPVWVTAQGLTAVAREPFPIAAVAPTGSGRGGTSGGTGSGADGGGAASGGSAVASPDEGSGGGLGGAGASGGAADEGGGGGAEKAVRGSAANGGERAPASRSGSGSVAEPPAALEQLADDELTPAETDDGSSPSPTLLIGLLLALAVALGAGFLWYRRRLP